MKKIETLELSKINLKAILPNPITGEVVPTIADLEIQGSTLVNGPEGTYEEPFHFQLKIPVEMAQELAPLLTKYLQGT